MTAVLEFCGVTVKRGTLVLDDVTFSVNAGEIVVVAGPSGSGKTTLLRVLLGLLAPTMGMVNLRGIAASLPGRILVQPEKRNLAVVFQDLALWPHLTVRENLSFGLVSQSVSRDERERRIMDALRLVDLSDFGRHFPGELSGGERQRVAIARALVLQPDAILLDEPLTSLDVMQRREILALFSRLFRENNVTTVYVTHDPREAIALAHRIILLERGRIVQMGSLDDLRNEPATDFARIFAEELTKNSVERSHKS